MKRTALVLLAALGGALLSGCGDDKPYSGPDPNQAHSYSAPAPIVAATAPPANPDPMPSESKGISTTDPLLSSTGTPSQPDPLAQGDPLQGRAMPTDHSHWLTTEADAARVSVSLNGMRLSSSQPSGTQDITMKLRPGPNTLTVVYAPQNAHSWGSVTVTEGEHEGQGLPLAEFRQAPLTDSVADESAASLKPTTQTFTFFAK